MGSWSRNQEPIKLVPNPQPWPRALSVCWQHTVGVFLAHNCLPPWMHMCSSWTLIHTILEASYLCYMVSKRLKIITCIFFKFDLISVSYNPLYSSTQAGSYSGSTWLGVLHAHMLTRNKLTGGGQRENDQFVAALFMSNHRLMVGRM